MGNGSVSHAIALVRDNERRNYKKENSAISEPHMKSWMFRDPVYGYISIFVNTIGSEISFSIM